jgi:REP element-mobilizing transposase RayT
MARPLRIEYPGAWYHLMNRGRRHENIFLDKTDYRLFLEVLEQTCRLFRLEVHAYSLRPNHYHLLARTPLGNLSRAMRHLNGVYTQKFNRKHGSDGVLFRGRYKSILVEEEAYLLELVRYIHRNAHKADPEVGIGQYEWDSHKWYMNEKDRPEWLKTKEVLSRFSPDENEARIELDAFVGRAVPDSLLNKLEKVRWPSILGGKGFKEKVEKIIKKKVMDIDVKEISGYKRNTEHMVVDNKQFEEKISRILSEKKEILEKTKSRDQSDERKALVYLLRHYGMPIKEIGEKMGNISYVSVSRQYKQAEEEIEKKMGCYEIMRGIIKGLKL